MLEHPAQWGLRSRINFDLQRTARARARGGFLLTIINRRCIFGAEIKEEKGIKMADLSRLPKAELVERKDLARDLMIIKLKPQFEFPAFKPGQYVTIGVGDQERAYSVVSASHELPTIELFIELVPEEYRLPTSLTPRLFELRCGDLLSLRPRAKGVFLLDTNYDNHVFISTVTGIAPFVSMMRSHFKAGGSYYGKELNVLTLQGASYMNEFGYIQEMKLMAANNKGYFFYIPTVSRPTEPRNEAWRGVTGRVNTVAVERIEKRGFAPDKTMVYLCGNEKMIEDLGNKKETPEKPLGKLVKLGYNVKDEVYF